VTSSSVFGGGSSVVGARGVFGDSIVTPSVGVTTIVSVNSSGSGRHRQPYSQISPPRPIVAGMRIAAECKEAVIIISKIIMNYNVHASEMAPMIVGLIASPNK
jgi:hypothetical protein